MRTKFASVLNPARFAYVYDSDGWRATAASVNPHFRMYETYNDGQCQHSGDWAITQE